MRYSPNGFTIVELLIVIVVIAIIASITAVAYNGVTDRARLSRGASFEQSLKSRLGDQLVFDVSFEDAQNASVAPADTSVKNAATAQSLVAVGTPGITTGPMSGKAAAFDGVDDRFTTPDQLNIAANGDFTYSFWFYANTVAPSEQFLLDRSPTSGSALDILIQNTGTICARIGGASILCATNITTGKWYHFAYMRKNNAGAVYLDGAVASSGTVSTGAIANSPNIGSHGNPVNFFNGRIDNFRIYAGAP